MKISSQGWLIREGHRYGRMQKNLSNGTWASTFVLCGLGIIFRAYNEYNYKLAVGRLLANHEKLIWKFYEEFARPRCLGAGRASFSKIQILNMSVDISLDISKLGLTEIFTAITSIFNILFFVDLIEYNSNNKITCKYLHYILNFWHKICQH